MKTRQELAAEYGIDRKTFYRRLKWLKMEFPKGRLSPKDVAKIYETLGDPNPNKT